MENIAQLAEKKIVDLTPTSVIQRWKEQGLKIVFTNGCFDILHVGHLSYLMEAAKLGDKLVIGLNSDESVRRLKGENRPINAERNRALMLVALFFVDAVVVFEEDTPLRLIQQILPKVLVKGGDYRKENIVGAKEVEENGGDVVVIDFLNGYSSTSIINKISNLK